MQMQHAMRIGPAEQVRMERAHVHAWPALRTARVDGWLWRSSGGGSQRANSVSTIDFTGTSLQTALTTAEALYRAQGAPARFHTYDQTNPPGLEDALINHFYQPAEPTTTMFRPLAPGPRSDAVRYQDAPWPGWLDVYLDAITPNRRDVNRVILDAIPAPRAFFACSHNGEVVATALCIIAFRCAVIECVATRPAFRRQGFSRTVLTGLLGWAATQDADLAGLQVTAANTPAMRLYTGLGFTPGATNRFWIMPPAS
ncbi:MAG TPA: GNAT family N-acetyltransferase [Rhodopila sp.]|nr:GNAT family N-acetyltransferase [Rhodopila sp.]